MRMTAEKALELKAKADESGDVYDEIRHYEALSDMDGIEYYKYYRALYPMREHPELAKPSIWDVYK